jgi:hypothetical protein
MRELIRPPVELPVGELGAPLDDCDCVGRPLDLLLEQLVEAKFAREVPRGVVPLDQQLVPLGFG